MAAAKLSFASEVSLFSKFVMAVLSSEVAFNLACTSYKIFCKYSTNMASLESWAELYAAWAAVWAWLYSVLALSSSVKACDSKY